MIYGAIKPTDARPVQNFTRAAATVPKVELGRFADVSVLTVVYRPDRLLLGRWRRYYYFRGVFRHVARLEPAVQSDADIFQVGSASTTYQVGSHHVLGNVAYDGKRTRKPCIRAGLSIGCRPLNSRPICGRIVPSARRPPLGAGGLLREVLFRPASGRAGPPALRPVPGYHRDRR